MKTSETMARRFQSGAEKIKNELRETVESYKKSLEILGGVRRVHKKDGSDFQNRLKNFDFTKGGEFFLEWGLAFNSLKIYGDGERIYLDGYTTDAQKVEKMRETSPERIVNHWIYIKKGYYYNADELREEIKETEEKYKKRLADAEKNLADFDANFADFQKVCQNLGEFLDTIEDGNGYKFQRMLKDAL